MISSHIFGGTLHTFRASQIVALGGSCILKKNATLGTRAACSTIANRQKNANDKINSDLLYINCPWEAILLQFY